MPLAFPARATEARRRRRRPVSGVFTESSKKCPECWRPGQSIPPNVHRRHPPQRPRQTVDTTCPRFLWRRLRHLCNTERNFSLQVCERMNCREVTERKLTGSSGFTSVYTDFAPSRGNSRVDGSRVCYFTINPFF